MKSIFEGLGKRPIFLIIGIIALTLVFLGGIKQNASIETDLDEYMPSDHPAFVFSDKAEELFGIQDGIILAIEHPESIYNTATLEKIRKITTDLPESFPVIKAEDITSLYTAENITADEFGLEVNDFYTQAPSSQAELEQLRRRVEDNEMVYERLVSSDGRAALIMAEISDDVFSDEFYANLKEYADRWSGPETIHIAGRPVVEGELGKLGPQDMARMAPLVLIVMIILLLFLLRSLRDTIINLVIVLFGTVAAFGLKALLGIPVYSVDTMMPVMLIAIGVAYGIHMHNTIDHLVQLHPGIEKQDLVRKTLTAMVRPVSMTAVTTAVGFTALLTSEVLPVRFFGLFTATGVLLEMLLALLLFPASIFLFGPPRPKKKRKQAANLGANTSSPGKTDKFQERGRRFTKGLTKHPKTVILIATSLTALAAFGATQVWIETSFLANFEKDSEIVRTDNFVNKHFGGTSTLNVILSADEPDTFKDPQVLFIMDDLQNRVEEDPAAGASFAVTDFMRRMHKVMHEDRPEYNKIPENREMIAQYLLLYEMSGDPDNLNQVIDYDYQTANLTIQLKSDSSAVMNRIIKEVETFESSFAEHGVRMRYAGSGYKAMVFSELLLQGQIWSLALSFAIVAVLLWILFGSLFIGLVGVIPIALTAVVNFGVMGLTGIPLSSATALISSIAVGIGVDYAIHLIEHYRSARQAGFSIAEAAADTMSHTGRAIILNTVAVMGGFSVLLVSVFPPNRQVGGLIALNMASSALGTLTILLLILIMMDRKERFKIPSSKTSETEGSAGDSRRKPVNNSQQTNYPGGNK
ncbi:MAG: MMPL family transporter [Spirochaetales bacterium]|nr:MMPL family transporter [Spirochaetales bacterium]MCF7937950.1 MMPL family transporter [Spirochaetales bacterium]